MQVVGGGSILLSLDDSTKSPNRAPPSHRAPGRGPGLARLSFMYFIPMGRIWESSGKGEKDLDVTRLKTGAGGSRVIEGSFIHSVNVY